MTSVQWTDQASTFAGIPILSLVDRYGTPLFVYDQDMIINRIHEVKHCMDKYEHTTIYYASKAFLTLAMANLIANQEIGIDVASRGELFIAIKGQIKPSKILYHGNNKSKEDIIYALSQGVRKFVIDSIQELMMMNMITDELQQKVDILIRIIPKIEDIQTHKNITTGHTQSKFGIDLDRSLDQVMTIINDAKLMHFLGFHFHLGSQLFTNRYHLKAIDYVFNFIETIKIKYQRTTDELNIGGGFAIQYKASDKPMPLDLFIDPLMQNIKEWSDKIQMLPLAISIEPGRYLVGGTAILLYTVGTIKDAFPYPMFAINGGMTENLRVALYNAQYEAMLVNRYDQSKNHYTIVGQACESTDVMIHDAILPEVHPGDTIAFLHAGAYEHSLANNFNKTLKPRVIMVYQGKDRIIQEKEALDDLIRKDYR